jgi:hypothetical protein
MQLMAFGLVYVVGSTKYIDPKINKRLVFLTNQLGLPALSIADLYRCRWHGGSLFQMDQGAPL